MSLLYGTKSLGRPWTPPRNSSLKVSYKTCDKTPTQERSRRLLAFSHRSLGRVAFAGTIVFFLLRLLSTQHGLLSIFDGPYSSIGPQQRQHGLPPEVTGATDWSRFAYCTYATNPDHLCNSLMLLESLHRLGAKVDRLLLYPREWSAEGNSTEAGLIRKARDEYGVHVEPIGVVHFDGEPTWADGFTKLLAFNQTRYERVLSLDSDGTILQVCRIPPMMSTVRLDLFLLQPMDELFLLPKSTVAMPRAYWMNDSLSAQIVLIAPSDFEFHLVRLALQHRGPNDFDMEIINGLHGHSCTIMPHRPYNLLSGEFRGGGRAHKNYLDSNEELWEAEKILKETKYVHFSDWPYPKPWVKAERKFGQDLGTEPKCYVSEVTGKVDCSDR